MHAVILSATFLADCDDAGLSEEEVSKIVAVISSNPLAGDIITGTGGARKYRFAGRGKGKSAVTAP